VHSVLEVQEWKPNKKINVWICAMRVVDSQMGSPKNSFNCIDMCIVRWKFTNGNPRNNMNVWISLSMNYVEIEGKSCPVL